MTIHKYVLDLEDRQTVSMPRGAEILTAQVQSRQICLWARVDPDAPSEIRAIRIAGTGHPIEDQAQMVYIATVQTAGGALVWHVFEQAPQGAA